MKIRLGRIYSVHFLENVLIKALNISFKKSEKSILNQVNWLSLHFGV